MAFVFRLERVLGVRRIQEDAAQQRHAAARAALEQARRADEDLRARLSQAMEEFDGLKHRDELTAEAVHLHSLHLAGLRRRLDESRVRVEEAARAEQEAAVELREAHQARESLERLRERERLAWNDRQARQEARHVDEIAVSRHRSREEENHGP